jgi:hypothetical protein
MARLGMRVSHTAILRRLKQHARTRLQRAAIRVAGVDEWAWRKGGHLAMRFRGLLRGGTVEKLDVWLRDARRSGIYGMQRFARALRHDIAAVRNAVLEPWSNGQTEGQINRLKTLKRCYGAGGEEMAPSSLQTDDGVP